jgi:RNA polymerase sigma-54 factor
MRHLFLDQRLMSIVPVDVTVSIEDGTVSYELAADVTASVDTIREILSYMFKKQAQFFADGFKGLVPMTLGDVADAVGVDESTVSSVLSDKYMKTPVGVYPVKVLAGTGFYKSRSGEMVSRLAVMEMITSLVDSENKAAPLSDAALTKSLESVGIVLSRRVVAKYRQELDIDDVESRKVSENLEQ